ncbi:MAG: sensor domain-containing diguanylate cyclase [Thermoanaerobaculia bacterium]
MSEVFSLDPHALEQFLERRRASLPHFEPEMSLADNLVEVLRKANEFVPSEAGSILLDNPRIKQIDRSRNRLTFLAAFGDKAQLLVGQTLPANQGIAGHVYLSGKAYSTTNVASDRFFDASVDAETQYRTESLVAIPIRIGTDVCGVLELVNRRGATYYSDHERDLLEIFADYISIAIQNVLDGRLAQEAAKRDNLTGLFNDRYLHSALEQTLARCRPDSRDLALLFLDLDYFKLVNDRHGHLAGSQVLRETGQLLRRAVGLPRALVARYGGDEFVIVVPDIGAVEAMAIAERLRAEVERAVFCDAPGEIQPDPLFLSGLSCSIGVATLARHISPDQTLVTAKSQLLRLSDSAMYRAKEAGRNRVMLADTAADTESGLSRTAAR